MSTRRSTRRLLSSLSVAGTRRGGTSNPPRKVFVRPRAGTASGMPPEDGPGMDQAPEREPSAERPSAPEVEVARGTAAQTPLTMINAVAVVIGAVVVLALV